MDPQPNAQCPITSSLREFPDYWDWLRYPGLSPVLVSIAFPPLSSISRCFFHSTLHLKLDFIGVSSLRPTYLHSFGRPFTYISGEFPDVELMLVPDVVDPEDPEAE